jgi:geranyl-CoA carboxylase beta subunit
MCGRGFAPRFLFAWPNNRVSVMGGEQAAKVLSIVAEEGARARGIEPDKPKIDASGRAVMELYERTSSALYATARIWDDGLIDPRDTRKVVSVCLATAAEGDGRRPRRNSFGIARF